MNKMTDIWFTSDLHFNHTNIIEYCNRPYRDIAHMNEMIIHNYNERVKPDDIVWILGDVCMGRIADTLPIVGRLNGHKHLILGNHDRPHPTNKHSADWWKEYEKYFESMRLNHVLDIGGEQVLLSHFPYQMDDRDTNRYNADKLSPFYPKDKGGWLLHGHVHSHFKSIGERQVHVGIDAWDYRPIHIDEVDEWMKW